MPGSVPQRPVPRLPEGGSGSDAAQGNHRLNLALLLLSASFPPISGMVFLPLPCGKGVGSLSLSSVQDTVAAPSIPTERTLLLAIRQVFFIFMFLGHARAACPLLLGTMSLSPGHQGTGPSDHQLSWGSSRIRSCFPVGASQRLPIDPVLRLLPLAGSLGRWFLSKALMIRIRVLAEFARNHSKIQQYVVSTQWGHEEEGTY